jgi:hypothetical protein
MSTNQWERFDEVIETIQQTDTLYALVLRAIANVRRGLPVDSLISSSFVVLGRQAGSIFSHGFHAVAPFIITAQMLVELCEKVNGKTGLWMERLDVTTCSFRTLRPLLAMRIDILEPAEALPHRLRFLQTARKAGEWNIFAAFLRKHFPGETADVAIQYEKLRLMRQSGDTQTALEKLERLISSGQECDSIVVARLRFTCANWLSRMKKNL